MNLLEDWLKKLTKKPIASLNDKYTDEEIVRAELESLFDFLVVPDSLEQNKVKQASHVSDVVIQKLHKKIRNHPCEEMIWSGVFAYLKDPLPILVATDLVDRWIATIRMGSYTRQVDEVQWRLATFNEDALYTLIVERYQEPKYSVAQFETMLSQCSTPIGWDGLLYLLSFYETPSAKKKAVVMTSISREKRHWRKNKFVKERLKDFIREQSQ